MTFAAPMPPSPAGAAVYSVRTLADPGVALRLLNFFAQQSLVPRDVHVECRGDEIAVRIEQPGLPENAAGIIAEKMRSLVLVQSVVLDYRRAATDEGLSAFGS